MFGFSSLQEALKTLGEFAVTARAEARSYQERTAGHLLKRRLKKTVEFLRHTRLALHSCLAITVW